MSYAHRRRFLWVIFLIGLALVAIVAAASATTLARLQFSKLVEHSSAIARVRCVHGETRMENGEVWTDTTFQVAHGDKGALPPQIVVRTPGGRFQHLSSHVDGVPEFRPGEEVYLFLTGRPGTQFHVVGWTQGTFRIRKNALTGVEFITQDSTDTPAFDPETRTFTKDGMKQMPMDRFLAKLRSELQRQSTAVLR